MDQGQLLDKSPVIGPDAREPVGAAGHLAQVRPATVEVCLQHCSAGAVCLQHSWVRSGLLAALLYSAQPAKMFFLFLVPVCQLALAAPSVSQLQLPAVC